MGGYFVVKRNAHLWKGQRGGLGLLTAPEPAGWGLPFLGCWRCPGEAGGDGGSHQSPLSTLRGQEVVPT